jgi:hypothetical protein
MGRPWSLRIAVTAGVLLLFALGAGAPAWGAGAKSPHRIIFDFTATPSWTQEAGGAAGVDDSANDVVIAPDGDVYVGGQYTVVPGNRDASLMKLVGGDSAWPAPKTHDGAAHGYDTATKMALGPDGSIYTAGYSMAANGKADFLVIKWSASGAVLWARRYDGPSHGDDLCTAIGVDTAGNVTVAGTSEGGGADWAVVSWSPPGVKRWRWRYDDSAHGGPAAAGGRASGRASGRCAPSRPPPPPPRRRPPGRLVCRAAVSFRSRVALQPLAHTALVSRSSVSEVTRTWRHSPGRWIRRPPRLHPSRRSPSLNVRRLAEPRRQRAGYQMLAGVCLGRTAGARPLELTVAQPERRLEHPGVLDAGAQMIRVVLQDLHGAVLGR